MWQLIILTVVALQIAAATPLVELAGAETRVGLLCGKYSIDVGQTLFIKSKNFKQNYPKNYECDYTFNCTDYAGSLVFNCNKFSLQESSRCTKDFLRVYDNNNVNTKFCGTNPPQNVTTGENFLGIEFKTNKDSTTSTGFFCSVKCGHVDDKTTTTTTSTPTPPTTSTTTQSTAEVTTVTMATPEAYSGCRCGIPQSPMRIVGGDETEVGAHPWQVGLTPKRLRVPYCGGSLLNNRYVITAAHCVDRMPTFDIILGEHDWQKVSHVIVRKPAHVTTHPDYDSSTYENDIAIIRLDNPVNLNSAMPIKPVCLPDPATDFTGKKAIATGWGLTSQKGDQSSSLQEVEVTVTTDGCPSNNPNIICAGEPEGDKDYCGKDDGGPLVVEVDGRYVLAGVTSTKTQCATQGKPGVYAKVQSSLDWINSVISDGKVCEADMAAETTKTLVSTTTAASTSSTVENSVASTTTTTMATTAAPTQNPGLQCYCGIPPNPLRAAGLTSINNHPWTVALISKGSGKQYCSGTIINTFFILTAKSCVTSPSDIEVRANAQDISDNTVSRYINRNVVATNFNQDLALLQLDNPLSLTNWDGMRPACLPAYDPDFTNAFSTHSGYGNLYPSTTPSLVIKKTDGYLIWCSAGNYISCFQPAQQNGFCGADIGGPIVSEKNGRYYLAGVALKDNGCSTTNNMIFQEVAEVKKYYQWIWDGSQAGRFCAL